jgi:hypothetical protein
MGPFDHGFEARGIDDDPIDGQLEPNRCTAAAARRTLRAPENVPRCACDNATILVK